MKFLLFYCNAYFSVCKAVLQQKKFDPAKLQFDSYFIKIPKLNQKKAAKDRNSPVSIQHRYRAVVYFIYQKVRLIVYFTAFAGLSDAEQLPEEQGNGIEELADEHVTVVAHTSVMFIQLRPVNIAITVIIVIDMLGS